ncbi:MAG: aspartate aminotransferase family protein [Acidimicrobiia bacterium]
MSIQGPQTVEWFDRALAAMVNGVSSGWRYWGPDETIVLSRGEGSHLFDSDGKKYIDYHCGFGPIILGHADPDVTAAVAEAAASGTTFAFTQEREILAAETVKQAVPWVEKLRFTNTGTEATMHAVRLARGFTARDVVIKFEGTYHGAHDYVMYSTPGDATDSLGSPYRPIPVAMSSGMPETIMTLIRTLPFNDLEGVRRVFANDGNRVAAVLVEPMLGNAMGIQPAEGFLAGLRELCDANGTVLIFDEVKTGFRVSVGGAAETYGVTPDLATFAKAMGNGVPVAAIAGRGPVLDGWAQGGIVQAGTYSGNSMAAAAARATIEKLLTGEPMAQIGRVGTALMEGCSKILAGRGVAHSVEGVPAMFGFYFGEGSATDYRSVSDHDEDLYEKLIMGMIERGVMPSPDALEPWFVSAAHSDEDVATTLQVFEEALVEALG